MYINSLTGLRGLAALIVFVSHAANQGMLPWFLGNGFGQLGVMLFFILSGFLMGLLYLGKEPSARNIGAYIAARAGRILPLYFALLLISVLISMLYQNFHYQISDPGILLRAILMIDAPYEFWTIPVETQFYGVFIGLWILHQRRAGVLPYLGLILLSFAATAFAFRYLGYVPSTFASYSLPFLIGISTALAYEHLSESPLAHKVASVLAVPSIIALFLNLPAVRLEHGWVFSDQFLVRTWVDPLNWLVVCSVFYCVLFNPRPFRFLTSRPLLVLGQISFGFYLLHYPVLKLVKDLQVPHELQFVTSALIVSVLAWLSFHYFEQPANIRLKGLLSRLTGREAMVVMDRAAPVGESASPLR